MYTNYLKQGLPKMKTMIVRVDMNGVVEVLFIVHASYFTGFWPLTLARTRTIDKFFVIAKTKLKKRRNQPRNKHQRHNTQFSQDKKSSHRYPSEESHLKLALHQKQRRKFLCRVPVAEDAGSERQQQTDRGVSLASFAHVVNVAVVIFKCEWMWK
jgi:hypothetical protein